MRPDYRSPIQRVKPGRWRRWKRGLVLLFFLIFSVLLQGALGTAFRRFNLRPDLVLVVCLWWALRGGSRSGWGLGMAGGFLKDVFSSGPLGWGMVSLGGACALVVFISRPLDRSNPLALIVLTAVAALAGSLIYLALSRLLQAPLSWSDSWRNAVWPHLWQTTAAAVVWLPVTARVLKG